MSKKLWISDRGTVFWFVFTGSLVGVIHFCVSLITWCVALRFHITSNKSEENLTIFINAIPSIILFIALVLNLIYMNKSHSKALVVFLLCVIVSVSCFAYEASNHMYQFRTPVSHIGGEYFNFTVAFKEHYYNWWYKRVVRIIPEEEKRER